MPYYEDDSTAKILIHSTLDVIESYLPFSELPLTAAPAPDPPLDVPPLLLSFFLLLFLFASCTAFLSIYNTTLFAFHWSRTTLSLGKMQALTPTSWGVGKTSAQWWFGRGKSRFASGSRKKRSSAIRARKNKRKSAWMTEDDAAWDDAAAEVDLGEGYGVPGRGVGASGENAWSTARDAFFSFMGSANDAASASKNTGKQSTKPKAENSDSSLPSERHARGVGDEVRDEPGQKDLG